MSDIQTQPDPLEPLVRRYLLSGDEEAMDRLVERTRPKLLAVARRIGAPQDAEDAVQGAYMALVRKRGSDLEAPVLPWLLTTVIRLAYRRKAKQQRQRDLAARLARPGAPGQAAPDTRALAAEQATLVRATVARLPATYRDAVVLRHLEGLSTRETAALLEITEPAVRTRLHRATRLLQGRMPAVLMALLLFLPWCAADAFRRLGPLTRPAWGRPVALAALAGGGLLLGAVALFGGLAGTADGPAARRPAPAQGDAQPERAAAPPAPEPDPEGEPSQDADERPAPPEAPRPVPRRDDPAPGRPEDTPEDDGRSERERPPRPRPETLPPGVIPIDAGAQHTVAPPPGMVLLEGGHVPIGTPPEELARLLAGRPAEHRALFAFEAPRHRAFLRPYYIGRYEVTNAQYLRFLEDHRTQYTTGQGALDTLEAIAAHLVQQSRDEQRDPRQVVWRQLYFANKGKIWRALGTRMDALFVWNADRSVDEARTARALRTERLPADVVLDFYSIRPPAHWPALKPPAGQAGHPVRYVSYNEAERFAEWAGMRVPTEQEWEWAARGAEAHRYPWGERWHDDASHANWGGKITDEAHEPRTVRVDRRGGTSEDADGRSWCGLHHMCGNVAEWTSSWFEAYPGGADGHAYMGRWVKVIRGGSAASGSKLTLRAACRNFVGAGPDAPPYPGNRFRWVGLRLAAWRQPGRDHVPPMLRRIARPRKVKRTDLAPERFAGFVTRDWDRTGATPPDHIYVRGRSRAVVFVPVGSLLRDAGLQRMRAAWKRPSGFKSTKGLRKRSEEAPWILGALHTDLELVRMQVPVRDAAPGPRKKRRDTRGRAKAPPTEPGTVAPGTYALALFWGRLALLSPTLELVGFLPEPAAEDARRIPSVEVSLRTSKELGTPTLNPTLDTGEGDLDFGIPLGGRGLADKYVVRVRTALPYAPGVLYSHAPWLRSR